MTKPESYPFLRIAKQFGVDYGAVLRAAHWVRFGGDLTCEINDLLGDMALQNEIFAAVSIQIAIADGDIDWMTGEPSNPQMRAYVAAATWVRADPKLGLSYDHS